ncbi:nicotinamide-nucleotide adenylyltransferase [Candidatus Peregrinibacteria bacterium]|nr:MAG: nicotinamide-nucleotide adenylyltransferase [Candidatus Peregrinibacteria bacterium]
MHAEKTALYIGRFQPFHLGHLDAVRQIFETDPPKCLLIGIGSAEENYLPQNPFTAGERFQMIAESLAEIGIPRESFFICPVRNINHYALWAEHVRQLLPPFSRVFSGSKLIRQLFSSLSGITPIALEKRIEINATTVRNAMLQGENWRVMVPAGTACILEEIRGEERLQNIAETESQK